MADKKKSSAAQQAAPAQQKLPKQPKSRHGRVSERRQAIETAREHVYAAVKRLRFLQAEKDGLVHVASTKSGSPDADKELAKLRETPRYLHLLVRITAAEKEVDAQRAALVAARAVKPTPTEHEIADPQRIRPYVPAQFNGYSMDTLARLRDGLVRL